jgi:hypothetical protein
MKTKIAIIIERADVELGGAERSVSELAEAIGAIGCDTHILAARGKAGKENVHILCGGLPGKRTDRPFCLPPPPWRSSNRWFPGSGRSAKHRNTQARSESEEGSRW